MNYLLKSNSKINNIIVAYKTSTNSESYPPLVDTKINSFDKKKGDPFNSFNTNTGEFTVPMDGTFYFNVRIGFDKSLTESIFQIWFYKFSSTTSSFERFAWLDNRIITSTYGYGLMCGNCTVINALKGDRFYFSVWNNNSSMKCANYVGSVQCEIIQLN